MFAIKVELKLNNKEKTLMAKHAGFSRFVYNYGLILYKELDYTQFKGSTSKKLDAIKKIFTNITKNRAEFEWMKELSSRVYQHSFMNLKDAFTRFFQGQNEYPKFKSKKEGESFTVDNANGKSLLDVGKRIKIPTLGNFRLKEKLKCRYVTQTFTISKTADKWYVSFTVDADRITPLIHPIESVGIDLGVSIFATTNDSDDKSKKIAAPPPMKKAKTKLAKMQYRNRNKQLGSGKTKTPASKNAKKYYQKLAKQHAKIANQRKDFLHKLTTDLSKTYYRIRIEDLNVQGMIANRKLSAAISDLGFYEFRRQLEYKQYVYGTKVEIVDRWYPSSKQCMVCLQKHTGLSLSDRIFDCPHCDAPPIDRDIQAAINLRLAPDIVVTPARG
ncbi:RNA-guided endonuclease InsQ/TnpB family protein [Iningainema tapete]|uniref:RNA-guided endonuclease InsQ/TnpB family protein n=1 Tax=Iningainema tapete TaxID=2806730 RepID=UPI00192E2351|nr:RNA-guided endonuclease TnpB family protein [Iningainema tapete]